MYKKAIFTLGIVTLLTIACNKSNRFEASADSQQAKINFVRFDSILINTDSSHMQQSISRFYKAHPGFTAYFAEYIMNVNPTDTTEIAELAFSFNKNTAFRTVNADVEKTFKNIDTLKSTIAKAYQIIQTHLPDINTPDVYFFVSGFNQSIIVEKDFVGVGLDLYLGSDYPAYNDMTYKYMLQNMKPSSIAPDLFASILSANYPFDGKQERLLEKMIYNGKLMYVLSTLLPDVAPNDIIGYSKFQWEWSRKYENKIWQSIVGQNHIFSTDLMTMNKYINDAPFTSTISQESPGRLGIWVGWQIVNEYMKKNSDISLKELIQSTDYQNILTQSEYNPK